MSYPAYEKYKESGVPWLGQVPEGWEVKPLKHLVRYNSESLPETTDPDFNIKYVDISSVNLVEGITNVEEFEFEKAPSRARRIVRDGDTIVSTVRTYLKAIAAIRNPEDNLIVSTGFAVIRPEQVINPDYLGYYLQSEGFIGEVVSKSVGVSYPAINASDLVGIEGLLPKPAEQKAIAAFLDKKTAEIDALIAKKEELLKLLAEQRTALITHAVTKGLNPSAPMKDSGIDWLGQVPEHWEVKKVKYVSNRVYTGGTPPSTGPDYFEGGSVAWFSPSDFRDENIYLGTSKKKVRHEVFEETGIKLFPENSVLLVGIGATLGKVGVSKEACTSNQQINAIVPKENILPAFLTYFLLVQRSTLKIISNSTTLGIINQEKTKSVELALPPLEEQQQIVEHVDEKVSHLNGVQKKVEDAVEGLKEYRSALITNAVTGKIKVV